MKFKARRHRLSNVRADPLPPHIRRAEKIMATHNVTVRGYNLLAMKALLAAIRDFPRFVEDER